MNREEREAIEAEINKVAEAEEAADTTDDGPAISTPEQQKAFEEGSAEYMAQAFRDVVHFAEIGVMAGAERIDSPEEKKLYINRGASSCFVFKQLIKVFEKEISKFSNNIAKQMGQEPP